MEVDNAVRRHLLSLDAVRAQTQTRIWRHRLTEGIEGTGTKAIVVSRQPSWASADPVKTNEFPVVFADCYADPTRDSEGNVSRLDAEDKAFGLARTIDPFMHGVRGVRWGAHHDDPGLMIVSCVRAGQVLVTAGDTHEAEPELGDTVYVRTTWQLDIAHG